MLGLVRAFGLLLLLSTAAVLLWAGTGLPAFGEPTPLASQHVAEHYLEHALEDSDTPSVVAVMIADYRSFDTLGETLVVFAAGLACFLLLRHQDGPARAAPATVNPIASSIIMDASVRAMVPIIQLYALYVVFHGHYSPGGGFQGGALLACSVLLQRLTMGPLSHTTFPRRLGTPLGIAGLLIYGGVGLAATLFGGHFLDYAFLPFGMEPAAMRSLGILIVEIGIALTVMGTLVSIFDDLSEGGVDWS